MIAVPAAPTICQRHLAFFNFGGCGHVQSFDDMAYIRYALHYSGSGALISHVTFSNESQTLFAALGLPEWKRRVMNTELPGKAVDLTVTVKSLLTDLLNEGPAGIDLSDLQDHAVNGRHLAVVLRATYAKRSETPGWKEALEVAKEALRRDGVDIDEALYGLLKG